MADIEAGTHQLTGQCATTELNRPPSRHLYGDIRYKFINLLWYMVAFKEHRTSISISEVTSFSILVAMKKSLCIYALEVTLHYMCLVGFVRLTGVSQFCISSYLGCSHLLELRLSLSTGMSCKASLHKHGIVF